jgi:hypothetical protein
MARKKKKVKILPSKPSEAKTKDFYRYLKQIYTNPSQGASFVGAKKLLAEVERRGYYKNVKLKDVQNFLNSLTSYSLFKQAKHKFPRPPVHVTSIDSQISVDLVDVSNLASQNQGTKFLLTCIEILSRKVFVRPLKTKEGKEVAEGMKSILEESGKQYERACSDLGSEFKSHYFQDVMKEYNIKHFWAGGSGSCNIVERFHRTLRSKINRYLYHNQTDTYLPVLQDLVKSYNNTVHGSIGMTPNSVDEFNEHVVYERLYLKHKPPKVVPFKFEVGESVRISYRRNLFRRERTQRWSDQLYTVDSRKRQWNINLYKLRSCDNEILMGSFYEQEMGKVNQNDTSLYKVESILDEKVENRVRMVKVHWQGYPRSCATWVPKASVRTSKKAV